MKAELGATKYARRTPRLGLRSLADPRNRTEISRSSRGRMDHHCSIGRRLAGESNPIHPVDSRVARHWRREAKQEGRCESIELSPAGSQPTVQTTTPAPPPSARGDLNHRPHAYQACALPLSYERALLLSGRLDLSLTHPKRAHDQAVPRPDEIWETGIEPATSCAQGTRSTSLSYSQRLRRVRGSNPSLRLERPRTSPEVERGIMTPPGFEPGPPP